MEATCTFEAVKIAWAQDKNGYILKLSIHPDDVPDDIALAKLGTRFYVGMKEADEDVAVADSRAVATAGALCRNKLFQVYLRNNGELHCVDELSAATILRDRLGVGSRSEISGQSAIKMMEIANDFRKWAASRGRGERLENDLSL